MIRYRPNRRRYFITTGATYELLRQAAAGASGLVPSLQLTASSDGKLLVSLLDDVANQPAVVAALAPLLREGAIREVTEPEWNTAVANASTPTAHKTSHATGGSDALTPADIGAAAASHTHSAYSEIQNALAEDPPSALADIGAAAYWDYSDDGNPVGTPPGYSVVSAAGGLWDNPSQVHWLSANDGEVTINPDHVAPFRTALGAAAHLTSGLTITKTGDWSRINPLPNFVIIQPQALQLGNNFSPPEGKWTSSSWAYSEVGWSNYGGPRLTSITFDDLEGITGAFSPNTMAALTTLAAPMLKFAGGASPNNLTALTTFSFPALEVINGNFTPNAISPLQSLSFPSLKVVTGQFAPSTFSNVTQWSFPQLIFCGNVFSPSTMPSLTTIECPSLTTVLSNVGVSQCAALTTLSLPVLSFVGGNLNPQTLAALTTLSLPMLSFVNIINIQNCTVLDTLSLPALGFVVSNIQATSSPAIANVTLPTNGTLKNVGGSVALAGVKLTAASVDNILQALATLDGTNGTTAYGAGRSVDLSGGTSAAPSNLGSTTTAGSNFVCSGTTCTVNWTGHGYATGDVLRISGITTATNANRYAVITVVNANQFTYTITSQTATGAGTATVVKAGNSAKALVARGVTLTTN